MNGIVVRMQGSKLIVLGLVIGLAGAYATTRVISSLLFGISATDRRLLS